MSEKQYLTEENYEKGKKKVKKIALTILLVGFLIGGGLIALGLSRSSSTKIEKLTKELNQEKQKLIETKIKIEEKIKPIQTEITSLKRVEFTGFDDAYYARVDRITELAKSIEVDEKAIRTIEDVTEDGFDTCNTFEESYSYTTNYCSIAGNLYSAKDGSSNIPFYMFGVFAIIASCMFALPIYMTSKGREINAFYAQQTMPIAKEGIETMAPTVGSAAGTIGKELAKGIKEGLKDEEK